MSIIIEGPDGAGKTTLLSELHHQFPQMEQHPRFCTSQGGPIKNLSEAVFKDTHGKPTHFIYDRHPILSEYVYRLAVDGYIPEAFLSDAMGRVRNRIAYNSLVIFCLPPLSVVKANISDEIDMPGVVDNIEMIYGLYQMHRLMWPGRHVIFDYTQRDISWQKLSYALADTRNNLWKESA